MSVDVGEVISLATKCVEGSSRPPLQLHFRQNRAQFFALSCCEGYNRPLLVQATRDDVFEALDALDAETRSERSALRARQQGESKGEGDKEDRAGKNNARVDLVAFIRLMRQRRTLAVLDGDFRCLEKCLRDFEADFERMH